MKKLGTTIFAFALSMLGALQAATTGSYLGAAKTLSPSGSEQALQVTLTKAYDEDDKTYDSDWGVYYVKVKVSRGKTCSIWCDGKSNESMSLSSDSDPEDENLMASFDSYYRDGEELFVLTYDCWDMEEDPSAGWFYFYVDGEVGDTCTIHYTTAVIDGEAWEGEEPPPALGTEENPEKITLTESPKTFSGTVINGDYYYYFAAQAGRAYRFVVQNSTEANPIDVSCEDATCEYTELTGYSSSASSEDLQPSLEIRTTTAGTVYLRVSRDTGSFKMTGVMLKSRSIGDHDVTELNEGNGYAANFVPGHLSTNPDVWDPIVDEKLFKADLAQGERAIFEVSNAATNLTMYLYDKNGIVLEMNQGRGGLNPYISYAATASGTYYVGVCQTDLEADMEALGVEVTLQLKKPGPAVDGDPDEWDAADDTIDGATTISATIANDNVDINLDAGHGTHQLSFTDWEDVYKIDCQNGVSYKIGTTTEEETDYSIYGEIFTVKDSKETSVSKGIVSEGGIVFTASASQTYYVRVYVNEGKGREYPAYMLRSVAYVPGQKLGYMTVNIKGSASAYWTYANPKGTDKTQRKGGTRVLTWGNNTVTFATVKGFSIPPKVTHAMTGDEAEDTVLGVYNDTSDPLDDYPSGTYSGSKKYAPVKLTPSAKGVSVERTLYVEDSADWYSFTGAAGNYYKFRLQDVVGDPEVRVYGPNAPTEECEYSILTNVSETVQISADKGTYYVKVAHADAGDPADGSYTLTAVSVVPGVVKLAKTAVSVKDSAGYADVSVSRTGKDGVVRVKYRTEGAQTDKDDAYYYPTDGILEWAAGDNKAKTVRVKLVPYAGWGTNKTVKVVFSAIPADDESFDTANEYVASFAKDTKTGLPLDTATITITASTKKAPGTIQVADCETPKKPVLSVTAGKTIDIPFERVLGADGIIGVKVETVKGTANKSGETDFGPVTTNLVWSESEADAQVVSVATKAVEDDFTAVKTFTLKLKALTSTKGDAVQYDKPSLASATVTVNILNEKFTETFDVYSKGITAAAFGYTVKEGKKGQWVVLSNGSFSAPNGGDLTFTFATTGTFMYTVDGEKRMFTATAKDKTLKVTDASTFSVDGYELDGEPVALRQGVKYAVSLGSEGTVKAANLPAGLKLAQDKKAKEWTVSGTPSKAGVFQAVYTTTVDRNTPAVTSNVCYTVEAEGTAAGTFNGLVSTTDTTNGVPSLASVTITAALGGKLSASVNIAGKKYAFADTGYKSVDVDMSNPGAPVTNLTAALPLVQKIGTGKTASTVTNWLYYTVVDVPETDPSGWLAVGDVEIQMAALPDAKGSGFQENITYMGRVCRDNSKSGKDGKAAWEAAMAAHTGYYTVSLVVQGAMSGNPLGSGYVTMTLDAKGKAKLAGKLADGTAYSGSATAALAGDSENPSVCVPLFAQKGTWVFGGWLSVKVGDDGVPVVETDTLVWANDNPASTRDGEDGFALDLYPVGGWYDTVSNLQRSYLESDLSVELPEGDDALDEIMEALALGEGYAFKAQPSGQTVDLVGNTLSVEKQSLAKDAKTKLVDWDSSANAANVKLTFKRATGIVSGTFDLWYEGLNAKGATEQKAVSGLKHEGVLVLSRGDDGAFLDEEVLSSGFFLAPQNIKYIDAKGKEQKRKWTGSYRFDIKAIPADRTWTDADPGI